MPGIALCSLRLFFGLRAALGGCRKHKALLLCFAQELASRAVDEMQLAASLTDHGYIGLFFTLFGVRQPMLHIHGSLGTFEYDVVAHAGQYIDDRRTPKYRMFT